MAQLWQTLSKNWKPRFSSKSQKSNIVFNFYQNIIPLQVVTYGRILPHSDPDVTALTLLHYSQLHPGNSILDSDPDVTAITSGRSKRRHGLIPDPDLRYVVTS